MKVFEILAALIDRPAGEEILIRTNDDESIDFSIEIDDDGMVFINADCESATEE